MGYDAVTFGPRELRFGVGGIRSVGAAPPVVLSNIVATGAAPATSAAPATGAAPEAVAFVVREIAGVRIGVFGLCNPSPVDEVRRAIPGYSLDDPQRVAREQVAAFHARGVDVVVLLSQLGPTETDSLITRVPGIDVVITGRGASRRERGARTSRATPESPIVLDPIGQGRSVDVVDLVVDETGICAYAIERVLLNPHIPLDPALQRRVIEMNARVLAAGHADGASTE